MRILHIEDRFHPSMGYQPNFFAKYHDPLHEFHILSSDSFSIWDGTDREHILNTLDKDFEKRYGIKIHRARAFWAKGRKFNIWLRKLKRNIRQIDPDIIYVHFIETYTAARIILNPALRRRYRIFTDTHNLMNQYSNSLKHIFYYRFFVRMTGQQANKSGIKVFATVKENFRMLTDIYRVKEENILFSPIGTDLEQYRYDKEAGTLLRQEMGILPGETVVLYTGKINHLKEPHLILLALQMIEDQIDDPLAVVFVGSRAAEYYDRYFNIILKNKQIRIFHQDAVSSSRLYAYYSMADLAVFPKENTLSALDAQACRLPVIMDDEPTNRERLEKGGILFRKGDISDLAQKILTLIENCELRVQLGQAGYEFVKDRYDYRSITGKMEKDLLAGAVPG